MHGWCTDDAANFVTDERTDEQGDSRSWILSILSNDIVYLQFVYFESSICIFSVHYLIIVSFKYALWWNCVLGICDCIRSLSILSDDIAYLQFVYFENSICIFLSTIVRYLIIVYFEFAIWRVCTLSLLSEEYVPAICILWGYHLYILSTLSDYCVFWVYSLMILRTCNLYTLRSERFQWFLLRGLPPLCLRLETPVNRHLWPNHIPLNPLHMYWSEKSAQKIGKTEGKVVVVLDGRGGVVLVRTQSRSLPRVGQGTWLVRTRPQKTQQSLQTHSETASS